MPDGRWRAFRPATLLRLMNPLTIRWWVMIVVPYVLQALEPQAMWNPVESVFRVTVIIESSPYSLAIDQRWKSSNGISYGFPCRPPSIQYSACKRCTYIAVPWRPQLAQVMYAVSGGLVGAVHVILLLLCGDTKCSCFVNFRIVTTGFFFLNAVVKSQHSYFCISSNSVPFPSPPKVYSYV
jgi:hypothetical protein